jgi:hypothetical protein
VSGLPPRNAVIGFTASRLDPMRNDTTSARLMAGLTGFRKPRGFVTGACVGGDHRIAEWLLQVYPDVPHLVIVPADRSRVYDWWSERQDHLTLTDVREVIQNQVILTAPASPPRIVIRYMPPGTTYRDRNAAIIAASDCLVAFPEHREGHPRSARSGSWMTVRMARKEGKMIYVFPLSDSGPST